MEARTEYPALLANLTPDQAVSVFNDRIALINKVNSDIADWLQERRKVEEAYVVGLRKLGSRPQGDAAALGIFQLPWQRIVSGVENSAASHERLAQKIENDIEKPLRQFQTRDSEMKSASNSQPNLANIAKDLSTAQKKAAKAKAQALSSKMPLANGSPKRPSSLSSCKRSTRDTHEADQIERSRASAESCLNALLNLETADEIKIFTEKVGANRRSSAATSRPPTSSMVAPPEPPPSRQPNMMRRMSSTSGQGQDQVGALPDATPSKSKLGGLKRLGTVMGRRKNTMPPPPTPEKKKDRRSMMPFRRGDSSRSFQDLEESGRDLTPATSREPQTLTDRQQSTAASSRDNLANQTIPESPPPQARVNGTSETCISGVHNENPPPPSPPPAAAAVSQLPPALQPQNTGTESEDGSRAFAIRDQPIKEDESEAQNALSSMANQLRMQGQTSGINRVQGSVRGRRDVRNTMFVPAGVDIFAQSGLPAPPQSPPLPTSNSTTELASPIQPPRQKSILEDHPIGSDAGSIHSSHSLAMPGAHPELHEPGLNVSIVETVNSWFNETGITKSMVTGEIALAYNGTTSTNTETIRLQHFELLEKVAANPTFVSSLDKTNTASAEDAAGTYTIALSNIKKSHPTVGLKYQLHLEPDNMAAYSPILLTPAWQLIDGQASVILLYSLNPTFATVGPVTFKNVAISVSLDVSGTDPIKPTAAMMHPTAGASFRRKAGTVTWRFNELSVKPEGQERLLVRFTTASGMPKKGGIELKFELPGRTGSQVGVQRRAQVQKEKDPFADEEVEKVDSREEGAWVDVERRRVLVSGRYSAS
ncbi:uncharacterized protein AB675_6658 [Cyphellophora attinorum]|uniref:MHD domain-containing protein n=1 Tax=Cyphellophora attinorum TaxID=1664694 RepID=A0A0N1P106_9EURO|nr:uncharacterized protein AB675_6658 [Phialophora attinorum]KPI43625.1 hypothetical protein AB675_6658 [Phialophora attinorum]